MQSKARIIFSGVVLAALLLSVGGVSAESGVVATAAQAATILYAKPGGLESGDCQPSWVNACELRYALGAVAVAGDEIWVARGVYTPGTTISATFVLTDGVALYGGFAMTETARAQRNWAANVTVLSGDIGGDDGIDANGLVTTPANIRGSNAYHVVVSQAVTDLTVLDGLTITGGYARGMEPNNQGAGMRNFGGRPTLTNLTFSGNTATQGGGLSNSGNTSVLTHVIFSGNEATSGGGLSNAASSPTLIDVTFTGNTATQGGGMYNEAHSSPSLTHVTFSDNTATVGGGMGNTASSPSLTNVTFSGNMATNGGGMDNYDGSNPTLTNVTFGGNLANSGSGMYNHYNSSPTVRNTLFVKGGYGSNCDNYETAFAAGSTNNLATDASCGSSTPQADHLYLGQLGRYGGRTQTLPLLSGSAAIDAGNAAYCPATDQRGVRRWGQCDIGAFEWWPLLTSITYLPLVLK